MDADSVARVAASRRRCLPPIHIVDADHPRSSACCHHRAGGSGSSGDEAVSLLVCSVDWSVLTVNIIRLHGRPQLIISSNYT